MNEATPVPGAVCPVKKAGLEDDPLDQVTRELAREVRDFAQEMLHRVLRATSHQNFGRAMLLIERISRTQADFTVDLLPGIERFERGGDRPAGLGEGNDLPSIETFGAQMMRELTGHLGAQNAERNKPDINQLVASLERAKETGQDKVAEAIQKKIDEVVESGEFVAREWVSRPLKASRLPALAPPALPTVLGACEFPGCGMDATYEVDFGAVAGYEEDRLGRRLLCGVHHTHNRETVAWHLEKRRKEKEDADDVVPPEDER